MAKIIKHARFKQNPNHARTREQALPTRAEYNKRMADQGMAPIRFDDDDKTSDDSTS